MESTEHLKSIHNISNYGKNDNVKQKNDRPTYSDPSPMKNDHSRCSENKISEMKHYPNPSKYHNFTNRFYSEKETEVNNTRWHKNTNSFTNFKKCTTTILPL